MSEVPTTTPISSKTNLPLFTLGAVCVLVALGIIAAIFIPARNQSTVDLLVTMIIASVPGMIGAAYSERNSRDMRNGVLEQKAKDGATKALQETGVTDTVDASGRGAVAAKAIEALDLHTQALTTMVNTLNSQSDAVTGPVDNLSNATPTPTPTPQPSA